ncbi:hypothetical protein [Streptomyces odonnellii]|uniref:hypothetical protein n=1 Tax=Streptomyces odonnellii TaxID=1417980 RepID=UPI000B033831|nr:hypothetical protein [Streptomyces odonnellii]
MGRGAYERTERRPATSSAAAPARPAVPPEHRPEGLLRLQQTAGNASVRQLLNGGGVPAAVVGPGNGHAAGGSPVQRELPKGGAEGTSTETLGARVAAGKFKEVLEYLNGRSMDGMVDEIEKLGFAHASYLLGNLGAAAWLGPYALARLEAGLRTVGLRQTGTTGELLTPLLDAVIRSGVRQRPDQFEVVRRKVPAPAGGWGGLVRGHLAVADFGEFFTLTAADNAFRLLDFVPDPELGGALDGLTERELRLLIVSHRMADRYDGERIRRALDGAWRARFPQAEPPWPVAGTAAGMNVAAMSVMDKLAEAIRRAEKYGGEEVRGKVAELLTPQSLALMAGTTILFAVLEGSTAGAAGVALIALSAALVGPEVYQIAGDINGFISTAVGAQDEAALDLAGQFFAKAAVAISIDILVAVLLHKPTRAATPKIQAAARATGEFLKSRTPAPGRPPGELIPALAMAADGPRFVQAPPERLAPLESRGGGPASGGTEPGPSYDTMPRKELRKLAKADADAANALVDRYRVMSDAELRKLASAKDKTARAVLDQRTSPNDAELARLLGSDYRPPHSATVTVKRGGAQIYRAELTSGNMSPSEAALGYPRNSLATHTEARAVRNPDVRAGDVMTITGQYEPCAACTRAMYTACRWLGIKINYVWLGGSVSFP